MKVALKAMYRKCRNRKDVTYPVGAYRCRARHSCGRLMTEILDSNGVNFCAGRGFMYFDCPPCGTNGVEVDTRNYTVTSCS